MSTKTSIKRIAAVAAVALTLGGFSAVSANATINGDTLIVGSTSTNTYTLGSLTPAVLHLQQTYVASTGSESASLTATLVQNVYNSATSTLNTTLPVFSSDSTVAAPNLHTSLTPALTNGNLTIATDATAAGQVNAFVKLSFSPTEAGTYVIKVTSSDSLLAPYTWTVVATKPSTTPDVASTVSYMAVKSPLDPAATNGLGLADYYWTSSWDMAGHAWSSDFSATAASTSASASTLGQKAAVIYIKPQNAAGTISNAFHENAVVTLTGPGYISFSPTAAQATAGTLTESSANSGQTSNYDKSVFLFSDGKTGLSTVTISVGGVLLATYKITFSGTATKVVATAAKTIISATTTDAVTAVATDSNGNPVAGLTLHAVSDSVASITDTDATAVTDATGTAKFTLHVGATAGTAKISVGTGTDATATGYVGSSVSVRKGSATVASATLTADSDSYVPGQLATFTITLKDADGNLVSNTATATGALTSTNVLSASSFLSGTAVTANTGTVSFTANMPATPGDVTITFASDVTGVAAASVKVNVGVGAIGEAAQAAIDAAQEATDAANAAYDAANNAMDSADAATAAAQDASDNASAALAAVTELSATVAKLVASVNAIAAALAKLQASNAAIQKKLKA